MPERAAIGLTMRQRIAQQPAHRAIVKLDPVLQNPGADIGSRLLNCDHDSIVIVWMNDGENCGGIVKGLQRTDAVDITDRLAGIGKIGAAIDAQVVLEDHAGHATGDILQQGLRFITRQISALSRADVLVGDNDTDVACALEARHAAAKPTPFAGGIARIFERELILEALTNTADAGGHFMRPLGKRAARRIAHRQIVRTLTEVV